MQTLPHSHHWEDRFYLCDDCLHDLLEFMKEPTELVIPKEVRP